MRHVRPDVFLFVHQQSQRAGPHVEPFGRQQRWSDAERLDTGGPDLLGLVRQARLCQHGSEDISPRVCAGSHDLGEEEGVARVDSPTGDISPDAGGVGHLQHEYLHVEALLALPCTANGADQAIAGITNTCAFAIECLPNDVRGEDALERRLADVDHRRLHEPVAVLEERYHPRGLISRPFMHVLCWKQPGEVQPHQALHRDRFHRHG